MTTDVDVAIVGAGQAGLGTSWVLTQAGVEHVILEAGRVAETWRSRRWDSFCLVTPNWSVKLPGAEYAGPDPDGFMLRPQLIDYFEAWAASFKAPIETGQQVSALDTDGDGFVLTASGRKLRARSVVVASGAFQRAHRPAGADGLTGSVHQLLAEQYRNPDQIPPGAVLIVGSGQTGCQLAEELHASGRKVFVACGRCVWTPRRMNGKDFVRWSAESGWFERPVSMLQAPTAVRLAGNPQATGNRGGHDMHFRTLHAQGVELLGRYAGAEGSRVFFADDLAASVDFGDARLREFLAFMQAGCAAAGIEGPEYELPEPFRVRTRTELDLTKEGISTVIWTTGYRPDYSWVHVPTFDEAGFPVQVDGRSATAGLYFVGVQWLRKHKSSILYGVGEDAEVIANHIVESRR